MYFQLKFSFFKLQLNSQVFNCVEYRGRIIILCNVLNNILFSFAYFQLKVTLCRYSNLFCLVANSKFKISNVNLNSSYESYFRLISKRNILKEKENDSFFFFFKEKNRKLVWVVSLSPAKHSRDQVRCLILWVSLYLKPSSGLSLWVLCIRFSAR